MRTVAPTDIIIILLPKQTSLLFLERYIYKFSWRVEKKIKLTQMQIQLLQWEHTQMEGLQVHLLIQTPDQFVGGQSSSEHTKQSSWFTIFCCVCAMCEVWSKTRHKLIKKICSRLHVCTVEQTHGTQTSKTTPFFTTSCMVYGSIHTSSTTIHQIVQNVPSLSLENHVS